MNDAFIKLNLPSIPVPHYMGGEVRYHLGETTQYFALSSPSVAGQSLRMREV